MKRSLVFIATVLFLTLSCKDAERKPEHRDVPADKMMQQDGHFIQIALNKLISSKDTICGMSLNDGVADTLQINNQIYGFCSKGCKEAFIRKQQ